MEPADKKFENVQEVFNKEGKAVGFTLPGSDHFYKYLPNGGWKDQQGNKYSSQGVLITTDLLSEDEDDEEDQQILDEFEKMLDDDLPEKKHTTTKKQEQIVDEEDQVDYQEETKKYLQKFEKKEDLKDLPAQLHIYFKLNSKFRVQIQPKVESLQSTEQRNAQIKNILEQAKQKTEAFKQKNKWIEGSEEFDFSGVCETQAVYERYWYGHYLAENIESFINIKKQIEESEQFDILEQKTFYSLKSKFYLKKKMQATIQKLHGEIKELEDDKLVAVSIINLPQNFSCSYILDLFKESGTSLEEVHSINLIDEYTAEVLISKKGAVSLLNIEGYCHAQKQYVYLELKPQQSTLKKGNLFKIKSDSHYKIHFAQLNDVLALSLSQDGVAKSATKQEQEKDGYRVIIGRNALKKVLMYRGNSLNVTKIQLFVKP